MKKISLLLLSILLTSCGPWHGRQPSQVEYTWPWELMFAKYDKYGVPTWRYQQKMEKQGYHFYDGRWHSVPE